MAIVKSGPYLGFSGTIDGITYYQVNGKTVAKKKNKKSTKPATPLQQAYYAETTMVSKFLRPLKEFTDVGYRLEAKSIRQNANNALVSYTRHNALEGLLPDRKISLSKLLVSKGKLPPAIESSAVMTEKGLAFSWSTEIIPKMSHYSDQVMMLAYFTELKEACYTLAGAQRSAGTDLLQLAGIKKGYTGEVYISFIKNDHTEIADSVYLGQFNW